MEDGNESITISGREFEIFPSEISPYFYLGSSYIAQPCDPFERSFQLLKTSLPIDYNLYDELAFLSLDHHFRLHLSKLWNLSLTSTYYTCPACHYSQPAITDILHVTCPICGYKWCTDIQAGSSPPFFTHFFRPKTHNKCHGVSTIRRPLSPYHWRECPRLLLTLLFPLIPPLLLASLVKYHLMTTAELLRKPTLTIHLYFCSALVVLLGSYPVTVVVVYILIHQAKKYPWCFLCYMLQFVELIPWKLIGMVETSCNLILEPYCGWRWYLGWFPAVLFSVLVLPLLCLNLHPSFVW
mmetsp:Transcript_1815/g.1910  ORF Transcript_1815/g.1910 Transcript_1815/m.1910 type:complete len:296 (-) Transcript_1815:15-902(-)